MDETEDFNGIKILSGINTHPGSGTAKEHLYEYSLFMKAIGRIDKPSPVMIEIGSFWALWSLCFRKKFPNGKNILIELGRRQFYVGMKNFQLNGVDAIGYWGGLFVESSGTYKNKKNDLEYRPSANEYWDDSIVGNVVGGNLDFQQICSENKIDTIDVLHMDVQGSETSILDFLSVNGFMPKIDNIMVATHSKKSHSHAKEILTKNKFIVGSECKFGTVGGDGMIIGKKQ